MAAHRIRLLFAHPLGASPEAEGLVCAPAPPLTAEEREIAARAAWYWPEADATLASLEHGLFVDLQGGPEDPLERAILLTRRAQALGATLGAGAFVWEGSLLPHAPESFADQASDATFDDPPLLLWVALEARSNDAGKLSLLTRGLAAFALPEIEVADSSRAIEDLLEFVTDAALYLLTSSTPLGDGETLEVTRGTVRVRMMPSLRNDGSRALRLRLP